PLGERPAHRYVRVAAPRCAGRFPACRRPDTVGAMAIRLTPRLVVRSKIVPARIPDALVVRQRLLARLSTGAPFTLVAAMPGYGKTVAVRQWIDTIDGPVAWLSLDLLDEDPMSFWSDLLLALRSVLPGIDGEPSMPLAERGVTNR